MVYQVKIITPVRKELLMGANNEWKDLSVILPGMKSLIFMDRDNGGPGNRRVDGAVPATPGLRQIVSPGPPPWTYM